MTNKQVNTVTNIIIPLVAGFIFIPFLGQVHLFDWDEINFAESAREMIVSGDYLTVQIDYQPFWEKPPLFIWLQVASMKMFGINEFAARFPNAISGMLTLLLLFNFGKRIYNYRFGIIWSVSYVVSVLPFFYFKSGIIDPWFNLFIFCGIYFLYLQIKAHRKHIRRLNAFASAFFIGLAVLTKGPVGFLIFFLTGIIFLIIKRFRVKIKWSEIGIMAITLMLTGGFWFLLQIINGNFSVIRDFIEYQVHLFQSQGAGHGGFPLYHVVVLLFGVFPASIFAIAGMVKKPKEENPFKQDFKVLMVILLLTVLILFSIVQTKIIHYSSMCYFPITFLASLSIHHILIRNQKPFSWITFSLMTIAILYALILGFITLIGTNESIIVNLDILNDPFALASLNASVNWTGYEAVTGLILIAGMLMYVIQKRRQDYKAMFLSLGLTSLIFVFTTMVVFTPRIEKYTQHAAIEFYKEKSAEDAYIEPLGFKSYAHLFYGRKPMPEHEKSYSEEWLLNGNIDKKAYFVMKINKAERYLSGNQQLTKLYEKNGFVFAVRKLEEK